MGNKGFKKVAAYRCGKIIRDTEKAILLDNGYGNQWFPKSAIAGIYQLVTPDFDEKDFLCYIFKSWSEVEEKFSEIATSSFREIISESGNRFWIVGMSD